MQLCALCNADLPIWGFGVWAKGRAREGDAYVTHMHVQGLFLAVGEQETAAGWTWRSAPITKRGAGRSQITPTLREHTNRARLSKVHTEVGLYDNTTLNIAKGPLAKNWSVRKRCAPGAGGSGLRPMAKCPRDSDYKGSRAW